MPKVPCAWTAARCNHAECEVVEAYRKLGLFGGRIEPRPLRVPMISARGLYRLPVVGAERAELSEPRPAIYVFLNKLGALYVGQAAGARGTWGRVSKHLAGEMFDVPQRRPESLLVLWLRCRCALDHVERRMIFALRPILNRSRPRTRSNVGHPGCWCVRCMRGDFDA